MKYIISSLLILYCLAAEDGHEHHDNHEMEKAVAHNHDPNPIWDEQCVACVVVRHVYCWDGKGDNGKGTCQAKWDDCTKAGKFDFRSTFNFMGCDYRYN